MEGNKFVMSKSGSTTATADQLAKDDPNTAKAADKIHADMMLMRELLLEAVGSEGDTGATRLPENTPEVTIDDSQAPVDQLAGAPRLPAASEDLLKAVEQMDKEVEVREIAEKVNSMPAETLLSSAQLFGEIMCQANLAIAQQTVRSWKANLRADAGFQVDRTAGAVVGIPTFRSAFDMLIEKGYSAEKIRESMMSQDIELVLTAHPTEAQRRTILKKHQHIVELLGEYDKQALLTPGEISELKDKIRSEQVGCRLARSGIASALAKRSGGWGGCTAPIG